MSILKDYWWVLLIGFGFGGWATAQEMEQRTLKAQTSTIAAGVIQLQKRHTNEDAEEKGREEALREQEIENRRLCDSGAITGNFCDKYED